MNENILDIDISELLQRMAPPEIPDEVFAAEHDGLRVIEGWHKLRAVQTISGLLTEPALHANGIRLDWLLRLVISKANGSQKIKKRELTLVLNNVLSKAGVNRLEDPNEDIFCDLVATRQGNFRIFLGQWESANSYTQTLLEAFEELPDGGTKRDALDAVHALLILSDALAERAAVNRTTTAGGNPFGEILLPDERALRKLASRVAFTTEDLAKLGIPLSCLAPFTLNSELYPFVSDRRIGDTPLERLPLISTERGVIVANPNSLSLAIRAVLVETAKDGGMGKYLLHALSRRQERYAELTGFWPGPHLNLSPPLRSGLCASVLQYDEGSYLHVIQMPTSFEGFPEEGFATVRNLPDEVCQFIANDIARFWRFVGDKGDCRQSITVLLLSGWGIPHSFSVPIQDTLSPEHWQFCYLTFSDAAILGACDDGKLSDILRLLKQYSRLEEEGFSFMNPNGLINLFGFWQSTDGNLIPEHMREITPPTNIVMSTDELLPPRMTGTVRRDYRALQQPAGDYRIVQRTEFGGEDEKPIYASLDDLAQGKLTGAIYYAGRTWWIESEPKEGEHRDWRYQIWNAVLQWLAVVGPAIIDRLPERFPKQPRKVLVEVPASSVFERQWGAESSDPLLGTISIKRDKQSGESTVTIKASWLPHLRSSENKAEVELIARVLEGFSTSSGGLSKEDEFSNLIRETIGSPDWRWLHVQDATKPIERLAGHGLIDQFKPIPKSASYLVKCGSIWQFRNRAEGFEISGELECKTFLAEYRDAMLDSLISDIRQFDRRRLTEIAARDYQAARHEQSRWKRTIRALRAIRGSRADTSAFQRQNEINAVQRAAKAVLEIAACEARDGGLRPSKAEVQEIYAKTLLLAGNSQLFSVIRAAVIPPEIRISPGGDLLTERGILAKILEPGAAWLTKTMMDGASAAYLNRDHRQKAQSEEKLGWDSALRVAVESEYKVPAEAYIDFQFAMTQLAENREAGIFFVRHSEISEILSQNPAYPKADILPLLNRLTLRRRQGWHEGVSENEIDIGRFDRPISLINRPLLMIDDSYDPLVLVSPILISDSTMYSLGGLLEGALHNNFWNSPEAKAYAGAMAKAEGEKFEESVADKLCDLGLNAKARCKISSLLNLKVPAELGDIDVFAINEKQGTVWVIEAKNLRLCRTEGEAASRMSEYRGRIIEDSKGRLKPDKLLRHIKRVQYIREHVDALQKALKLPLIYEVKGLLIVDSPQPMNFHMLEDVPDGRSVFLHAIDEFEF